jgi:hypothetical protein
MIAIAQMFNSGVCLAVISPGFFLGLGMLAFGSFFMGYAAGKAGQQKAEKFKALEEEVNKLKNELANSKSQNK